MPSKSTDTARKMPTDSQPAPQTPDRAVELQVCEDEGRSEDQQPAGERPAGEGPAAEAGPSVDAASIVAMAVSPRPRNKAESARRHIDPEWAARSVSSLRAGTLASRLGTPTVQSPKPNGTPRAQANSTPRGQANSTARAQANGTPRAQANGTARAATNSTAKAQSPKPNETNGITRSVARAQMNATNSDSNASAGPAKAGRSRRPHYSAGRKPLPFRAGGAFDEVRRRIRQVMAM